jgi:dTMP kinase
MPKPKSKDVVRDQLARLAELEEKRGLLIVFEGPDGSGKTTQRKLLKTWLKGEGHDVVTTKWNSSELFKPLIKARKQIRSLNATEFSLLHACDFRHRLETEVLPALCAGKTVIADRYFFTALARDITRGMDLGWVMNLYGPILWPDVVFYFSVSAETSGKRIAAERTPSYYESGQDLTEIADPHASYQAFIGQVLGQYAGLATIFNFVTVDAEKSIYEQHQMIRGLFHESARRSWAEYNVEALADWLRGRPEMRIA